jgi:hypothetical protein
MNCDLVGPTALSNIATNFSPDISHLLLLINVSDPLVRVAEEIVPEEHRSDGKQVTL